MLTVSELKTRQHNRVCYCWRQMPITGPTINTKHLLIPGIYLPNFSKTIVWSLFTRLPRITPKDEMHTNQDARLGAQREEKKKQQEDETETPRRSERWKRPPTSRGGTKYSILLWQTGTCSQPTRNQKDTHDTTTATPRGSRSEAGAFTGLCSTNRTYQVPDNKIVPGMISCRFRVFGYLFL